MSAQHNTPNTLENIASELMALAEDLTQGKLRVGNRLVAIGNPEFIKTKQKITDDTAYFTLSFQAPLLDLDRGATLTMLDHEKPARRTGGEGKYDKELRLKGRPPEGKKTKKEIARLWKDVCKKLEQGQPPAPAEEKALVSAFEGYTVFSEPSWQDDWLACLTILQEALAWARKGDMPKALEYAAEVNRRTQTCHQKHK
ncbi:MAG: hypothetical protein A2512_04785 [Deltaproteobacteria bacterium RIFOXYD12_FULL_56_24]|nr:MAG: hypothetical protein A2512_04785 [Deltaproteobacteria bacterium RIFOXYD12_FULL_56_24]